MQQYYAKKVIKMRRRKIIIKIESPHGNISIKNENTFAKIEKIFL